MQRSITVRLFLMFAFVIAGIVLRAQSIQLHVDPRPSPYLSDWPSLKQTAFMILGNTGQAAINFKIGTQLYDGNGSLVAETEINKMPQMQISPQSLTQYFFEDLYPEPAIKYHGDYDTRSMASSGKIRDGNYRLCVELVDAKNGATITTQQCQYFSIVVYQQPILLLPLNGDTLAKNSTRRPIFKWTPVVPNPATPVTYRLQVMEIMEGQEAGQAFRTNHPILEKDYKMTTLASWPFEFQLPDAGKSYVWSVQAIDEQERPVGTNEGRAEYAVFSTANDPIIEKQDQVKNINNEVKEKQKK